MTLIVLDPFRIPAGGAPSYDPDVQTMLDARAALSDPTDAAYAQAISDYVEEIKAISGFWDDIVQLVVMAGATTTAGAAVAIKGNNLTNSNFVDADIDIKTGSKGNASNKNWDTGYSTASAEGIFGQNDIHAYCYVTEVPTTQVRALFGHGGSAAGATAFLHRLTSTTHAARARYSAPQSITPASATAVGGYGVNRDSSTTYDALAAGVSFSLSQSSNSFNPNARMLVLARSGITTANPESFSNARILVWALGTATTLSNYNTPTDNLIAALNAI